MQHRILTTLAVLGFLAVSACVETPTNVAHEASYNAVGEQFETTGNTIVMYNAQRLPNNYASVIASHGGAVVAAYPDLGVAVVSGLTAAKEATLAGHKDVRLTTPDYLLPVELPADIEVAGLEAEPASPDNPAAAVFFPRQWHLRAIQADQAWAAGQLGSPGVTVAILDTGLSYTHPDLAGLVDLSRSASFVPSDDALVNAFFPGFHPVTDLHWHGTHVGATVASNAFAAAGVTSKTTLIGVKVCNVNGGCPTSGVLAGVMYAADQGAHVINMSLAGLFLKSVNPGFVSVINRAFQYANRQGTTVVVAAGNANFDLDHALAPDGTHFPSLYASYCDQSVTACVSATGPASSASVNGPWGDLDTRAPYSNYGRSAIDVSAPGGRSGAGFVGNGGLVWAACSQQSLVVPVCRTGTFIIGSTGTSMASPHATGVAALLAERFGKNPGRIRSALHNTADDIGDKGTDPFFGKGRVNARKAAGL